MRLTELLELLQPRQVVDYQDVELTGVAAHPDDVPAGGLLGCVAEYLRYNRWLEPRELGAAYAACPAAAFITEWPLAVGGRPQLIVADARHALGLAARALHGAPDAAMPVVGITGTNGKTTTARLLGHLFQAVAGGGGSLGTLGLERGGTPLEAGPYTTPLAPELYADLARLRAAGCRAAAIEVSSHALALDRVAGLRFAAAVLTNLTRDHLDFHGTPEAYRDAKLRLFSGLAADAPAILNRDSPHYDAFRSVCPGPVRSYSLFRADADYVAADVEVSPHHTAFVLRTRAGEVPVRTRLIGRFQVENILAALAAAHLLGADLAALAAAAATFATVPGRMQTVPLANGATAVVDYAHNPDGLHNLLENCRALNPARIILVFGCGGDRDRGKRPLMGDIGYRGADLCWLTSDNPRTEDPLRILADILAGLPPGAAPQVEPDRRQAILQARAACRPGDLLVVAGKGHEDYQIIGEAKYPFSDLEELMTNG
jgi:UDP-N-acetylmuramoyl-L-alanyl-D-glutamate--2,6-diaminopimelate ligase